MTMKRTREPSIPADEYGRRLPDFTVNLLVSDVARSVDFYREVFGAAVIHADVDFAALRAGRLEFMVHADHTYDRHAWHGRLSSGERRGLGAELRLFHVDPDELEKRARARGATVLQASQDMPHGWRDVIVEDPDGYTWAVGTPK
jgi:catechol 2,3-dioxygenase-like lactoylglutathione lyase family enzyme